MNQHAQYLSGVTSSSSSSSKGGLTSLFQGFSLSWFDVYTKIDDDYRVKTQSGGYISLVGWIVILVLVLAETGNYFTPQVREHMIVDTTLGDSLKININMTFHALTCAEANVDAMDVAGDNQLSIEHSMFKQRISKEGILIGEPGIEIVGSAVKVETKAADNKDKGGNEIQKNSEGEECESCFGAESSTRKCCNSCKDLKDAYTAMGWSHGEIMKTSPQCLRDKENPFAHVAPGEGCRISGSMSVNKVAGNFHIAHGESIVRDGRHIHQFLPEEAPGFNISHTIHSISFGEPHASLPANLEYVLHRNPLDGISKIVDPKIGTGLYQYFIKVVPTIYKDSYRRDKVITTAQYTMTERFRPLMLPELSPNPDGSVRPPRQQQAVLPGLFFIYDMSPFLVEVHRTGVPFTHYFTKLCAIVGGVLSVMGVVDSFVHQVGLSKTSRSKNY